MLVTYVFCVRMQPCQAWPQFLLSHHSTVAFFPHWFVARAYCNLPNDPNWMNWKSVIFEMSSKFIISKMGSCNLRNENLLFTKGEFVRKTPPTRTMNRSACHQRGLQTQLSIKCYLLLTTYHRTKLFCRFNFIFEDICCKKGRRHNITAMFSCWGGLRDASNSSKVSCYIFNLFIVNAQVHIS